MQAVRNLSTGNTGLTEASADIVIGVAYTITVAYELGSIPNELTFSPVGNADFNAGTTRLLGTSVTFSDTLSSDLLVRENQLYFTSVPSLTLGTAEFAEVTYFMLPLTANDTSICPYLSVFFDPNYKYDNGYCVGNQIIPIGGELSMQLSKEVDRDLLLQGEELNYTIQYTNDGSLELQNVWIWDEVDPSIASITANTTTPSPTIKGDSLVAWSLGTIPPLGQLGSTGTLTVTVLVDGNGQDLPDGQAVVNQGFFGINPGSLPQEAALTSTVISTVQAPVMSIVKSDGQTTVGNGEELTYTIQVANDGSAAATNIVITDTLPGEVALNGPTIPPFAANNGGVLTWGQSELGDLAVGESLTITIPVLVDQATESFTVLTNTADLAFANEAGYTFDNQSAQDTTSVERRAGFVEGYAFTDTNGNGSFDSGESGLAGVTVSLPGAISPTMVTTGADGYYWFRVESEGIVVVSADLPANTFRTTPGTAHPEVVFDETQRADFGYVADSSSFGTVFGTVFNDTNRNGLFDDTEGPISGVRIDSADAVTQTVFTNDLGHYSFKYTVPVSTSVNETNPTGYVSTTPDQLNVVVSTGSENNSPYDFGDFAGIRIAGQVFEDANINGVNDSEAGLAGALMSAGGITMTTSSDGLFDLFITLTGGSITLTEQDPAGFVSTVAIPGLGMSWVDDNTMSIASPVAGTVYSGSEFGDVSASQAITVSGLVWDDNGAGGGTAINGQRDGAEPVLAGALVSLSSGANQTTGPDGSFELRGPAQTPITVTEVNPAGYVSTNALPGNDAVKVDDDNLFIDAQEGGFTSQGNAFGDVSSGQVITISGLVWDDNGAGGGIAANGLRDGAEPGLAGAPVSLSSGMSGVSGADGAYLLFGPASQVITLTESNPSGYISSGSIAGNDASASDFDTIVVNALTTGSNSSGNLFGDLLPAELSISKTASTEAAIAGSNLVYTITYNNSGPSNAQSVILTDTLPVGANFDQVITQPTGWTGPTQNGQVLVWNSQELAVSTLDEMVIQVLLDGDLEQGHSLTNTVEITSNMPDENMENNSATVVTTVNQEADLTIDKTADLETVTAGTPLTYTLVVANDGPSDATGVVVSDTLPSGLTLLGYEASQGSYDGQTWTIGELFPGQQATMTISTTVKPETTGSLLNEAVVQGVEFDPNENNNQSSVETTVVTSADLALTKTASAGTVVAGTEVTYTINVSNGGPSVATEVLVADELPVEVTYQSSQASQGTYNAASGEWNAGTLNVSGAVTLTIVVKVNSDTLSQVDNSAQAQATPDDPVGENDSDTATITVTSSADLAISKAGEPDPVASGDVVTYTLSYTNYGPSDALAVSIVDTLDANVVFGGVLSNNPSLPPVDQNGQILTWTLGTLQSGSSGTIVYYVSVEPGTIGAVVNEVEISSASTPDPDSSNDKAMEDTSIGSPNLATIFGYVFEDTNGNGLWDSGESALEGVSITLDGSITETTDASGLYFFLTDITGTRSVVEIDPANYFSTTPNEVQLLVSLGKSYRVDFGDAPDDSAFASLFGTVFDDINSNGLWDTSEVGLAAVTLTLDEAKTTQTDIYGRYSFSTTVAGSHTIVETDLPNYFSTTPNRVTEDITLNSGTKINFGDVLAKDATCEADSYEEDDVFGDANTIDTGVEQSHDFCDDAVDWTKLTVTAGNAYTITTSSYGQRADTFVEVYADDGITRLAANDDSESTTDFSSELVYRATADDEVLIKTTNRVGITGFHTDYDIQVEIDPIYINFLPIVIYSSTQSKSMANEKVARPAEFSSIMANWSPTSIVSPQGIITHSCPDVYEVDDSWTSAGPIISGVPQLHSFDSDPVLYAADKDFVSFTMVPLEEITFSVSSNTGTSALLEVYDQYGRALNLSGVDSLFIEDLPSGNYYLSANPTSLDFGCSETTGYTLEADIKPIYQLFLPTILRN